MFSLDINIAFIIKFEFPIPSTVDTSDIELIT